MSLGKKFQILLILFFVFWGSFFITKGLKAEELQSPVILNAFRVDYNKYSKIETEGLITPGVEVLVYINQKYDGLARIKQIDENINKFYYVSKLIKRGSSFEVMVVSHNIKTHLLSAPAIMTVKSILVKNMTDSIETLAENEEKKVILAKNSAYFEEKNVILANNIVFESVKKSLLILDKKIIAPTLISPTFLNPTGNPKPFITGLTQNDTFIYVYIDGILNGKISPLNHPSGVTNFAYRPFLNLDIGRHKVQTVAENAMGQKSGKSNILEFFVEYPMPAPTLLSPEGRIMSPAKPLISGVAKNDSFIKVFIDHELEETFLIKNDSSGVGNFAYTAKMTLNRGPHLVYATATNNKGKESQWSNLKSFNKYKPRLIATTTEENVSGETITISTASLTVEQIMDIPERLKGEINRQEEKSLLEDIKEKGKENNSFKTNLIIFISFLFIIIIWMFLVNKGLKREKTEGERKL